MFHRIGPYHLSRLRGADAASDATIIGMEASDDDEIYAWDAIESKGIRKITVFQGIDSAKISRSALLVRFRTIIQEESPSALFVLGWTHLGIAGLLAAREFGVPVVIMSESSAHDFSRNPVKEWIKKQFIRGCSAGLVGCESHRNYLADLGLPKKRVALGYDAIDNEHFSNKPAQLANLEALRNQYRLKKPFFLASGRFIPKKNLAKLYQAYSMYRELAGADAWDLVCLGDGELKSQLESLRVELGLESCIHMPGFMQYDELPNFYALADCFIHISTREQWGLVVNEAMASGLPVIISNRCGAAEIVQDDQNGWTVSPDDVNRIAEKMLAMTTLPETKRLDMGSRSKNIIKDWGLERFGNGFAESLQAALETPLPKLSVLCRSVLRFALARL